MTTQTEQEEIEETTVNSTPPSKKEDMRMLVRIKLKLIANYLLDGFAPVAAVAAFIVAVMAFNGNHSGLAQLERNATVIESLNASLLASKTELEKLKTATSQEKLLHEEASNKQNEQMEKIIQNVSHLQAKMKISPTLQEQLHQAINTSALPPIVAGMASSAAMPVATEPAKNQVSQSKVLTKAIEKFNQTPGK